jgi:hypothetical protein
VSWSSVSMFTFSQIRSRRSQCLRIVREEKHGNNGVGRTNSVDKHWAGKYDSTNRSPLTVTCRSELRNLQETKELSMNGNHTRVWPCVQHKHPRDLVLERARAKRAPAEAIFPHLPHCRLPTNLPLFPMRRLPFHMHVLFFNEFIFNSVRFKRKEVSHEVAIYHRKLRGSWAKLCGKVDRAKGNVFDCLPGRGFNYESVSIFGHDEFVLDGQLALLFSKCRKLVAWHDDIHAFL